MKPNNTLFWCVILFVLLILSSCADRRVASIPDTHLQPANLPQIGTPSSKTPDKTQYEIPRPRVLYTMIEKAEKELNQGRPRAAFQTLERAMAIDGQDPLIWHLMAQSRQLQGDFRQAESLARKSNTLARTNPELTKKNWDLIADALEKQGRVQEAEAARLK